MRDALHDKVDAREQLAAEATGLIESVKAQFADIFEATGGDIGKTMEALTVLVEDGLSDLTTKAVRTGYDGARKVRGT
jgi:hypothetical protein